MTLTGGVHAQRQGGQHRKGSSGFSLMTFSISRMADMWRDPSVIQSTTVGLEQKGIGVIAQVMTECGFMHIVAVQTSSDFPLAHVFPNLPVTLMHIYLTITTHAATVPPVKLCRHGTQQTGGMPRM